MIDSTPYCQLCGRDLVGPYCPSRCPQVNRMTDHDPLGGLARLAYLLLKPPHPSGVDEASRKKSHRPKLFRRWQ